MATVRAGCRPQAGREQPAGRPLHSSRRPRKALPSVTSSAYSRSAPTGQAARQPRDDHPRGALAHRVGQVHRGRLARGGRVGGHHDLAHAAGLDTLDQLLDAQVLGIHPVDRRQRTAEHVVAAAELVGALDRDHVARLLHDADHLAVAPLVLADPAARADGQVEADLTVADGLLDLADRVRQRQRLLGREPQDVERQPLSRALADSGHARQLGDQAVYRRGEHDPSLSAGPAGSLKWGRRSRKRLGACHRRRSVAGAAAQ